MSRLRTTARDERGYTILIVLAMMVIVLLIGAAALAASLSSTDSSTRDTRVRRAQQAADAGVSAQLYQQSQADLGNASYNLNGGLLGTGVTVDCIVPTLSLGVVVPGVATAYVSGNNACPQGTSGGSATNYTTPLGDHAYDSSEFFPNPQNVGGVSSERELFPTVVSLGYDNTPIPAGTGTVYSREKVVLAPVAPLQAIEGAGNVTINGLSALGISVGVVVNGDISAGGTLTTPAAAVGVNLASSSILPTFIAAHFAGTALTTAQYVTSTGTCSAGSPSTSCVIQRQPVTISPSKPDCSLNGVAQSCASMITGCSGCYSASTDSLTTSSGTTTLAGGDYVFCNFSATSTAAIDANPTSTVPVRIFIDSPSSARCSGDGLGSSQGNFTAANGLDNLLEPTGSVTGTTTGPSGLQIYVAGSGSTVSIGDSTTCKVSLFGVCTVANTPLTQALLVYAPSSTVTVNTSACVLSLVCAAGVVDGSVIGNNVTITASTITEDLDLNNFPLYAGLNAFRPVQYIQCGSNNSSGRAVTSLSGTESTDTSGC